MVNDTIADFLTRLRNASMSGKDNVNVESTKTIEKIAKILQSEGFLSKVDKNERELNVTLGRDWPITHIKRISKPGIRRYVKTTQVPRPKGGMGLVILSTPKGILTGDQARKQKVGGELICEVW